MLTKESIEAAGLEREEELSINEDGIDEEGGDGFDLTPSEGSLKAGSNSNQEEQQVLAHQETKAVGRLKLVVFVVLVASAVAVASTVSKFIRHNEYKRFKEEFIDDAGKVLQAVGITFDKTLRSFDSVATTFTTIAEVTNQTWPFVTIPNFAKQMVAVLDLSHAIHVDFIPVVAPELREQWEDYSAMNEGWINEALEIQERYTAEYSGPIIYNATYEKRIHDDDGNILEKTNRHLFPIWQNFPVVPNKSYTYNFDFATLLDPKERTTLINDHETIISKPCMIPDAGDAIAREETADLGEEAKHYLTEAEWPQSIEPMSDVVYPIVDKKRRTALPYKPGEEDKPVLVGLLSTAIYWRSMIKDILPKGSSAIFVVENDCAEPFKYYIDGPDVITYEGVGKDVDTKFPDWKQSKKLHEIETEITKEEAGTSATSAEFDHAQLEDSYCTTTVSVYPTPQMEATFTSNNSTIFSIAVVGIFAFTLLVFYIYDSMVEARQRTVMESATRSSAIVSSLFPSAVRDRLYPTESKSTAKTNKLEAFIPETAKGKLQSFLRDGKTGTPVGSTMEQDGPFVGSPIAELYPETTVLFADIAGFTAWSSVRNPTQVFHLLETVYAAFDEIARRRGVFKVETVGDSYVAVVGLPTARKLHAVVMAIFAHECRVKMNMLTRDLEKSLGFGTADLAMRFGLNSGPTTAGVLRGEKSRFQLFGDTVNTAARMESNGERNRIQVSQKTADLIKASGRGHWLTPRAEKVHAKGKGAMQTFWCEPKSGSGSMASSEAAHMEKELELALSSTDSQEGNLKRLIEWNVDLFTGLLNGIAERRSPKKSKQSSVATNPSEFGQPLKEVTDVIDLPKPNSNKSKQSNPQAQISTEAKEQLREFVGSIADMYGNNPFHNFDHCSHVAMSTKKLLDRIVECEKEDADKAEAENPSSRAITSDPLTQFAIIFAALIHDVDHPGVSNAQLVQEQHVNAVRYAGKSVAEQNSVDVAFELIMKPAFTALCDCIFTTDKEYKQFRQIVVNVVMATDLFDMDLKSMREARWIKSFDKPKMESQWDLVGDDVNRRATIIMELIIQASDVSHTMQHFTVYKKWNMCLLTEMYDAFTSGRTNKNPLDGWYEGELWFFDNYIIPLAQKLRECGVFGVSCDEFLDYAKDNRMEWETKGRDIVREATAVLTSK